MTLSEYPKTATLKDGTEVTLRPMVAADVDALHAFFAKDVPEEDRLYLRDDVADRRVVEGWTRNIDYDRVLPILMFRGQRVIADGAIRHNPHGWSRHMAEVRLVVARAYQGKGAGFVLLKELVHVAQSKKAQMLLARVFENSPGGISTFQKLGFRVEAVLHDFATDIKGRRQNIAVLVRDVDELWTSMEDLLWHGDWRSDS
ncbi:MAG: GNAT family N-acetyltransferase [Planctomycetota bacterium]